MGIRGLSSFISNRSEIYLKRHVLRETVVVIDGNNLLHYLYLSSPKQNASFGGDYNYFMEYTQHVLLLFKQSHVVPIVVFDGGLDMNDRKQQTRVLRAKQKIIASIKIKPSNQERMSVFPLLLRMTFVNLLKKNKIDVIQCQYEADNEIAALARGMKCPVISNDSDFYVMDVQVIPLSSMDLNRTVKCDAGLAIECQLFCMKDFLSYLGYRDATILPLLGTLLGNDYVDKRLFEGIFSQIHMPKSKKMNDQHKRVQGLLDFLKGQSLEDAIDRILRFVKKVDHIEVEKAIRISLEAYASEEMYQLKSPADLRRKVVAGITSDNLPEWFGLLYTSAIIPPWVLEATVSHRMPFQSQVESNNLCYSFTCCSDLLQAIVLICWDDQSDNKLITLWRKNSELAFKRLRPSKVDFAVNLPKISTVQLMTREEKHRLLLDIILCEKIGHVLEQPTELQLLIASVIHWARNSQCELRSYHIDGLIAGLIHLSIIEKKIGKVKSLKRLENLAEKGTADLHEYIAAAKTTFKFQELNPRMMTHDINYDKSIVHVLGEFQATYYLAVTLGNILNLDLPSLAPSEFYCGTFVYNAVNHFKGHYRLTLANKLYGNSNSRIFEIFNSITECVYDLAPSSVMEWSPHPKKPRKRNKKPVQQQLAVESNSSSSEKESDSDESSLVDNRFRVLAIA